MKIIIALLTLSFSLAAAPDCTKSWRISNRAGDSAVAPWQQFISLVGGTVATDALDNRAAQCNSWVFTYDSEGFSAVNIQLEDAPAAVGVAGTFVAYAGAIVSGVNPSTVTTSASFIGTGYYPYMRGNVVSATGTGSINITMYGYKTPALIGLNVKTTVPQWVKTSWLYVANGTSGCANANGCWVITKTNGITSTVSATAATTQTVAVTPPTANFWVGGWRVVPTVQCTSGATGLVVKFIGDNDALSNYGSPGTDLTAAISALHVTSGSASGSNDIAATQTATVTVGVTSGTIDQTAAGCAFYVALQVSTTV